MEADDAPDEEKKPAVKTPAKAPKKKPPADDVADPPEDDPAPPEEDASTGETTEDAADTGEDSTDDSGSDGEEGDDEESSDSSSEDKIGDVLRKERLYDAVADIQEQCKSLSDAATILVERIDDKAGKMLAIRSRDILDRAMEQCTTIRTHFAELGYERVRDIYATLRERVSAVAEIIKHVIDGDDDFRQPGSDTSSGKTPAKG